ncbi:MAG: 50S ribosomal protein L3, partial [Proteobacteria bacterium]|nr:50S ribosomal protein L3 [Pseudomonadota bacterium]
MKMTIGLVGRKLGMTRVFTDDGVSIPVTVIEAQPNRITQVKTVDRDGYRALQVTTGSRKASRVSKPAAGHFAAAKVEAGDIVREMRLDDADEGDFVAGNELKVDIFEVGQKVDVVGTSVGKGFAGVVKRHHFSMQDATHGNSLSHRAPGSIGQNQTPGRVFKGKKMAGHMGNCRVTAKNHDLISIDGQKNLLVVKGSVPGPACYAQGGAKPTLTDAALVLKTAGTQALVYFCDTFDGSPIADAGVSLWERSYRNGNWVWRHLSARTGEDGIATFRLSRTSNNLDLFAAAALDDHEAFSAGTSYQYRRAHDTWRIYAFTDRAAYRPGEEARWKLIARQYDGAVYSTPSNRTIYYEIFDPRGTKVDEKEVALNAFGSAWGSLQLTDTMPLGEYRVTFRERNGGSHIGDATLLRLEEYKL